MTLYEISKGYQDFLNAVENGEIPEEALKDTLDAIDGEFEAKADNVACMIKNQIAEVDAMKKEIEVLSERMKTKKNKVEWLRKYLLGEMQAVGKEKLETSRNLIRVRKSPPSVKIENEQAFISWAVQHREDVLTYSDPKPNKTAIKELIQSGQNLPLVEIVQNNAITIK